MLLVRLHWTIPNHAIVAPVQLQHHINHCVVFGNRKDTTVLCNVIIMNIIGGILDFTFKHLL